MRPDEKRYTLMELDGVISLGRGDPDLDTPRHIIDEAHLRMATPPAELEVQGLGELSDEVYEKLTFDEDVLSVATCDGMRERTVTLSSISKTYAMTGFRVGYIIGPPAFIEAATRLKSDISGPTALFSQYAALSAIDGPQDSVEAFRQIYAGRLGVMSKGNIPYGKPGGGFFLWADISRFGVDAETFCRRLLTEGRVLMFPGTAFGARWQHFVRISLLQPEERIAQALGRIETFVESLS